MVDDLPIKTCRNCGAEVSAEFCAVCGQREGRGDLQFFDAVGDVFGEVATPDSKFWRTILALLFKPGFLSAEFNAGRRASYLPPFRLYLVISFVTFLLISLTTTNEAFLGRADPDDADSPLLIGDPNSIPEEWRFRVELSGDGEKQTSAKKDASGPSALAAESLGEPSEVDRAEVDADSDMDVAQALGISVDEDSAAWLNAMAERAQENSRRVTEDPREYVNSLIEHLPQMMFLMLPVFAILLKIVYLFSPFHYLQHLVFALHLHSTAYIFYALGSLAEFLELHIESIFALAIIAHIPLALRRCYKSSWLGAIGRSLVLSVSYGMLLLVSFAVVAVVILATL